MAACSVVVPETVVREAVRKPTASEIPSRVPPDEVIAPPILTPLTVPPASENPPGASSVTLPLAPLPVAAEETTAPLLTSMVQA